MTNKSLQIVTRLENLGLNKAEAKIYIHLLESGRELGGSSIATGAGLHRQYVYLALPKLINQGLVKEVPKGKQNRYKAHPPVAVEQLGREQAVAATRLARELREISNIGNEQEFAVIQGKDSIQRYEFETVDMAEEGAEEYIIGGAGQSFVEIMGDNLAVYLDEKEQKNITVYYLGGEHERKNYQKKFGAHSNQQYRFLKKIPEGVNMVVRNNSVSFDSLLKPPLVYVIKSPTVAEHYRKFFIMLWEMAE